MAQPYDDPDVLYDDPTVPYDGDAPVGPAARVTKLGQRVLARPDANARVTLLSQRVLAQPVPSARVTLLSRRVLVVDWATIGQRADVRIVD